jgi:hypothetical protein
MLTPSSLTKDDLSFAVYVCFVLFCLCSKILEQTCQENYDILEQTNNDWRGK